MNKTIFLGLLISLASLTANAKNINCGASINTNIYGEDDKVKTTSFNLVLPSNIDENDKLKKKRTKSIGSIDGTDISVEVYTYEGNQSNIQLNEIISNGSIILSSTKLKNKGLTHLTYRSLGSNSTVQFWCNR